MKSRLALTLALSAAMWTTTGAQAQKERCGTRQPSLEESGQIELKISRARKVRTDVTIRCGCTSSTRAAALRTAMCPRT